MLNFDRTKIPDVVRIYREKYYDNRGSFEELITSDIVDKLGISCPPQVNLSVSKKGVVRGMHWQIQPHAQGKFVFCLSGSIYDVAIDLRQDSKYFMKHVSLNLNSIDGHAVWIPSGFAHGFQSLENETRVLYLASNLYEPLASRGLLATDPELQIEWPLEITEMSEKDFQLPGVRQVSQLDLF